jgi:hypothetical protein
MSGTCPIPFKNAAAPARSRSWVKAPTDTELTELAQRIAQLVGRFLERQGLLERDAANTFLCGRALEGQLFRVSVNR